ncbi:hypothetical protein COV82_03160 [Candidatus Peregrinibacteria bacterium CG11_big_fil_rev_8_21_14_0_20_46_8]|nr:MAG: hypothetical protein COV82_03160 [Candidatus Peregrinibacteria bacterium CG11_big_fil_rev_8_21_14_0_20_46_8]
MTLNLYIMKAFCKRSLLPIFLIIALLAPARSATAQNNTSPFPDVPTNHPFVSSIGDLKERAFVAGHPNGTFTPDRTIPRAEFITMVIASIEDNPEGANCFEDVQEQWYARFICSAKELGLVAGHPDGTFRPGNNISLAEASAILTRAYKLKKTAAGARDPWYRPFIENLTEAQAVPNSLDHISQPLSRAETSEIIWRLNEEDHARPSKSYVNLNTEAPLLESCAELKEKFEHIAYRRSKGFGESRAFGRDQVVFEESAADFDGSSDDASTAPQAAPSPTANKEADVDFTDTNVQVAGVDEADIIKTDGEYIYIANNARLKIVKATPAGEMELIAELPLITDEERETTYVGYESLSDLYVTNNTVVAIHPSYSTNWKLHDFSRPISIYKPRTLVQLIDISDKNNPNITRSLTFDGTQVSSRRINNRLFLVTNFYPNYYPTAEDGVDNTNIVDLLPHVVDSSSETESTLTTCSNIRFVPEYDQINFVSVLQIDLENPSANIEKEVIMGAGENIYANTESLYIAASRYVRPQAEIFDVWAPPVEQPSTLLYKFDISQDNLAFAGRGTVPGHILNQFSMDETDESFRIATTVREWHDTDEVPAGNYIFTVNPDNLAEILGQTAPLAAGEQIFSVRFLGDRAYMVTFRQVDPFFVFDLSDPRNPTLLGELKLPGFSDYLHPYDENHVIGFGKETVEVDDFPGWIEPAIFVDEPADDVAIAPAPFTQIQGMKIALFDVTDVSSPKVLHKELIGEAGTDSELLRNHKALMYDKERNLFAFPITVQERTDVFPYPVVTFRGAYVYNLDLENGFQLRGKLSNYDADTNVRDIPYTKYAENDIKRIIRIGNTLYSVSLGRIKATDLESMTEQKLIELPKNLNPGEDVVIPLPRPVDF